MGLSYSWCVHAPEEGGDAVRFRDGLHYWISRDKLWTTGT